MSDYGEYSVYQRSTINPTEILPLRFAIHFDSNILQDSLTPTDYLWQSSGVAP